MNEATKNIIAAIAAQLDQISEAIANYDESNLFVVCFSSGTSVYEKAGTFAISNRLDPQLFSAERAAHICRVVKNGHGQSPAAVRKIDFLLEEKRRMSETIEFLKNNDK